MNETKVPGNVVTGKPFMSAEAWKRRQIAIFWAKKRAEVRKGYEEAAQYCMANSAARWA